MLGCFYLGLSNFWKFERSTQIGPRAPAIDDCLHAESRVDILPWIPAHGRGGLRIQLTCRNLTEQRGSRYQFYERPPVVICHFHCKAPGGESTSAESWQFYWNATALP